ncbi:hypothetical protein MS3_00007107 [Schistosoma haematobium]|uniref:Egg protein CP391S-like protein n=1 Tax=Schistosoma haematobium TaxID=6185 RepID=A0A922ISM5_SCHHA|nr:hypothetical protein MS3_00007107 [Schistosoma haematobium]KAH9586050.1 hypothetical protein MS3_00007107 [Schistosoma haematobium]
MQFTYLLFDKLKRNYLILFTAYCQKHNTTKTCQNASKNNITCFWCERANRCIESNDQDTHKLKENDCRIKKSPDVDNPSTTTLLEHIETTVEITDVQVRGDVNKTAKETEQYSNITTEITIENPQNKLLWYLYIVIPLAVFFFAVCIGCIIWRWLHRRKRSNE